MKNGLLVVTGKDRPGIIAQVTGVLFKNRCNLEDVSMTILEGTLAMILVVSYKDSDKKKIEKGFLSLRKDLDLSFHWEPLKGNVKRGDAGAGKDLYLVTALGKDRTGIVHQISRVLASQKLNITDLNSKILGSGKSALYALALEVECAQKSRIVLLRNRFGVLAKTLGVEIQVKPVEHLQF